MDRISWLIGFRVLAALQFPLKSTKPFRCRLNMKQFSHFISLFFVLYSIGKSEMSVLILRLLFDHIHCVRWNIIDRHEMVFLCKNVRLYLWPCHFQSTQKSHCMLSMLNFIDAISRVQLYPFIFLFSLPLFFCCAWSPLLPIQCYVSTHFRINCQTCVVSFNRLIQATSFFPMHIHTITMYAHR